MLREAYHDSSIDNAVREEATRACMKMAYPPRGRAGCLSDVVTAAHMPTMNSRVQGLLTTHAWARRHVGKCAHARVVPAQGSQQSMV